MPERDRLAERVDVLVLDLFVDVGRQQARRELRVVGLFDDERRRGADGELVELLGGGAVAQARRWCGWRRAASTPSRPSAQRCDGPHDLVDVDRFEVAVALADPHGEADRIGSVVFPGGFVVPGAVFACRCRSGALPLAHHGHGVPLRGLRPS